MQAFPKVSVKKWGNVAVDAAKAAGYVNAGTIEFLLEPDGNFLFYGNEYPNSGGASGYGMGYGCGPDQGADSNCGWTAAFTAAARCVCKWSFHRSQGKRSKSGRRICTMPGNGYRLHLPGGKGVRVDSAIYSGYTIPPFYDAMIAKVSVWRKAAGRQLKSFTVPWEK